MVYFGINLSATQNTYMNFEFGWETTLSVDNERLDNQHRELLSQVNKLINLFVKESANQTTVNEAATFLDDYIKTHFRDEEAYMESYGYPHLDAHRASHAHFIENYLALRKRMLVPEPDEKLIFDLEHHLVQGGQAIRRLHSFSARTNKINMGVRKQMPCAWSEKL